MHKKTLHILFHSRLILIFLLFLCHLPASFSQTALNVRIDANPDKKYICKGTTEVFRFEAVPEGGTLPYEYEWTFSWNSDKKTDKQINVEVFSAGTITLKVSDNGKPKIRKEISYEIKEVDIQADFQIIQNNPCAEEEIQFRSTVSGGSGEYDYYWYFGDGEYSYDKDTKHKFVASGCSGETDFFVSLEVWDRESGCSREIRKSVTVQNKPHLDFEDGENFTPFKHCHILGDDPVFDVELINNSTNTECITSYDIDWGDGDSESNVSFPLRHTYTEVGSFEIVVTAANSSGCELRWTKIIYNQSIPVAGLESPGSTMGCAPIAFDFFLKGYEKNSIGTTYTWDFGDGTPQITWDYDHPFEEDAISHEYEKSSCAEIPWAGYYTTTVTVANGCGEVEATVDGIRVFTAPDASIDNSEFPVDSICTDKTILLGNNSVKGYFGVDCISGSDVEWTFGDGSRQTSYSMTPKSWSEPGNYDIILSMGNPCGITKDTFSIVVMDPPDAKASVDDLSGCIPFTPEITNNTDGMAVDYSWEITPATGWSFINGSTKVSRVPEIEFTKSGSYKAVMIAYNNCSEMDSVVFEFEVADIPNGSITDLQDVCSNQASIQPSVFYNNHGSPVTGFNWSFPGGSPSSSSSEDPGVISYPGVGEFYVTVNLENECGIKAIKDTFQVIPAPEISISPTGEICSSENFAITGTAVSNHVSYRWETEGDGRFNSSNFLNPVYTPGTQDINNGGTTLRLVALGNAPCASDTGFVDLSIQPAPLVGVDQDLIICEGLDYQIENAYADHYSSIEWSTAGDGDFSDDGILLPLYSPGSQDVADGSVELTLSVYPVAPCAAPVQKSFTITYIPTPTIQAGVDIDICAEGQRTLNARGQGYQSLNWTVSGGNGNFSNPSILNPVFTIDPSFSGNSLDLFIEAMGGYGCPDVYDTLTLNVIPYPVVNAGDDALLCESGTHRIEGVNLEEYSGFSWEVNGDGSLDNDNVLDPVYTPGPADINNEQVRLTLTAEGNSVCPDVSDDVLIIIQKNPAAFAGFDQDVCKVSNFTTNGEAQEGSGYEWSTMGTGSFDEETRLMTEYVPSNADLETGSVDLVLRVDALAPCAAPDYDTVKITFIDPPVVFAGNDTVICSSTFTPLGVSVENSVDYIWKSSGTGNWMGENTLTPVYFPSDADVEAGSVTLSLTSTNPTCPPVEDQMVLNLTPYPLSEAGEDDLICEDEVKTLDDALSSNYSNMYWQTGGDGSFSDETEMNPVYIPGEGDIERGSVKLYLIAEGIAPCSNSEVDSLQLSIQKNPVVFAGDDFIIGEGESYTTTTADAENITQITWQTTGDGSFSNPNSLLSTYTPGDGDLLNRSVDLIISGTSVFPCVKTDRDTIHILITPKPKANAGSDQDICEGSSFTVSLATAEEYSALYWTSSGEGVLTDETGLTPAYVPTPEDIENREVTLTLHAVGKDPIQDIVAIDSMKIHIIHDASAELLPVDTACENRNYRITGVSYSDVDNRIWTSSGDGSFSSPNSNSPVYAFSENDKEKDGIYFYLESRSISPCVHIDYDTLSIRLYHEPEPSFLIDNREGCAPLEVSFSNTSAGEELSYSWNFGNGEESLDESPAGILFSQGRKADTVYTVTLSAKNRCNTLSFTDEILVKPVPIADFGMNVAWGCSPKEIFFNNVTAGLAEDYLWDWGDGKESTDEENPESHIFETGDYDTSYTITLIAENECGSDTLQKSVKIFPNTVDAFFETDTVLGCAPLEVNFSNYSRGVLDNEPFLNWSWNFGDGNVSDRISPSHVFEKPGKYPVTLYVNDTCSYSNYSTEIHVLGAPQAQFEMDKEGYCEEDTVFVTAVNMPLEQIANIHWDFGDMHEGEDFNEDHVYAAPGKYEITLSATDINTGCVSTISDTVLIHDSPDAAFSIPENDGCQPLSLMFTNLSTGGNFYKWDFGNHNQSVDTNGIQTFREPGLYTVNLNVMDEEGCWDTVNHKVRVYPKPEAGFEYSSLLSCFAPVDVEFYNLSEGADDYVWSFGTGSESKDTNPSINYKDYGDYPVSLIATNRFFCKDTSEMIYHVYHNPVAAFTVDTTVGCDPFTLPFTNLSEYGREYHWQFGDQGSSDQMNPEFSFTGEGVYSVGLKVTGDGGCSDSIMKVDYITTNPSPISDFDYVRINEIDTVQFNNYSYGAISYVWDFGDGTTSEEENPWHKFRNYGSYNISLTSVNEYDCVDVLVDSIEFALFKGLYMPTAFSPDNILEELREFRAVGIGLERFHLVVYDTWGNLLWETTKLERGVPVESWDGRDEEGKLLPPDVYVWHLKTAIFRDGSRYKGEEYGSITLIR